MHRTLARSLALALLLAWGCTPEVDEADPTEEISPAQGSAGPSTQPPPEGGPGLDQGQQHPPLPADNPAWDWDAGGFVPDFGWYGEHSWADVRMRVAGHISTAGRDRARVKAGRGDLAGAAAEYRALQARLEALDLPEEGIAAQIGTLLREAAARDAETLEALAAGQAPSPMGTGLAALRRLYLGEAVRLGEPGRPDPDVLTELQQALLDIVLDPRPDLDIAAFEDFDSRHELRVSLYAAYLDSLDPMGLEEPWGYWTPAERQRQALVLFEAARTMGGGLSLDREDPVLQALVGDQRLDPRVKVHPTFFPTHLAEYVHPLDQRAVFTVEGLGRLPTGDSLIDVGAEPGPLAIGSLQRLGLEDPEHRAFLEDRAAALNAALARDPAEVPALVAELVATLDAHGHGSRYYNIKQARNEAVRVLARADQPELALQVLQTNYPLHHQDWACPNRAGILEALEGRLLAEAGRADEALARLEDSLESSAAFLAQVDEAERLGADAPGRRPPRLGPGGPGGPGAGRGKASGGAPGRPPGRPPGSPPPAGDTTGE